MMFRDWKRGKEEAVVITMFMQRRENTKKDQNNILGAVNCSRIFALSDVFWKI
jgi:hypothetical protein